VYRMVPGGLLHTLSLSVVALSVCNDRVIVNGTDQTSQPGIDYRHIDGANVLVFFT